MKRTYLDSCVLIAAFEGTPLKEERDEAQRQHAQQLAAKVLDDPSREFIVSDYLRLEVLPKPIALKQRKEVNFMNDIFEQAAEDLPTSPKLTRHALDIAKRYNLKGMDALHVGAAIVAEVDELVTMEGDKNKMCRVREIKVKSLDSSRLHSPPGESEDPSCPTKS